jgi:hypothetical protein
MLKIWENYITELHDRPNRPETLEVEPEEEVNADEKGPYILQSEPVVGRTTKWMNKGIFHPISGHEGPEEEQRYNSVPYLTSTLDRRRLSTPRLGHFTPGIAL